MKLEFGKSYIMELASAVSGKSLLGAGGTLCSLQSICLCFKQCAGQKLVRGCRIEHLPSKDSCIISKGEIQDNYGVSELDQLEYSYLGA